MMNSKYKELLRTANKCAFVANIFLALLLPFTLIGRISSKIFDPIMVSIYFGLCFVIRPNSRIRKSLLGVKQLIKDGEDPTQLIKNKIYCTGLYVVKFLLRIAMFGILVCIFLSYIPFLGVLSNKIRSCVILYVILLSNLNLGIGMGGYFSGKLSTKVKIFLNIIWGLASIIGFYLSSKAGLWKHLFSFGKLPNCTLISYFCTTLLFIQIGFIFYEFTIGEKN